MIEIVIIKTTALFLIIFFNQSCVTIKIHEFPEINRQVEEQYTIIKSGKFIDFENYKVEVSYFLKRKEAPGSVAT